ncbi:MAG: hypothetical protein QM490_03130 [Candidatus Gracilibacteria bacterium]
MNKKSVETEIKAVFINTTLTGGLKRFLKTFYALNKDVTVYCSSLCLDEVRDYLANKECLNVREVIKFKYLGDKKFDLTFKYSNGSIVRRDTLIGCYYDEYSQVILQLDTIRMLLSL